MAAYSPVWWRINRASRLERLAAIIGAVVVSVIVVRLVVGVLLAGPLGHPGDEPPSELELWRLTIWPAVLLWLGILATVLWMARSPVELSIAAAVVAVFALFLLGLIPRELAQMAKDDGWPTAQQVAYTSALSAQMAVLGIGVSVALVAFRGDWHVYGLSIVAGVAVIAVGLAVFTSLRQPFVPPDEVARARFALTGALLGGDIGTGDKVSVVFVIPKRSETGAVTGYESSTRSAVAAEDAECTAQNPQCAVSLLVDRGDDDAGLGPWLADHEAASHIYVIGPIGAPDPSPSE